MTYEHLEDEGRWRILSDVEGSDGIGKPYPSLEPGAHGDLQINMASVDGLSKGV